MTSGTVRCAPECFVVAESLHKVGGTAHAAGDNTKLALIGRGGTFTVDNCIVVLPREVMVVLDCCQRLEFGAPDKTLVDHLVAGLFEVASQLHGGPVFLPGFVFEAEPFVHAGHFGNFGGFTAGDAHVVVGDSVTNTTRAAV